MHYALTSREDPKLGLTAEMLCRRGIVRLELRGSSMLPSLWPGDLLSIQSASVDEFVPGDIVLVMRDGRSFVHRMIERQQGQDRLWWITKGDAVPRNDAPVEASELLGRVAGVRRGNRSFIPNRRVSRLRCALAWMLCRSGHFRSLALRVHAARLQASATMRASKALFAAEAIGSRALLKTESE
jgi:signal peptidase I